jgi:exodeoxyribonuclease VII small subunit
MSEDPAKVGLTYEQAFEELQAIIAELESGGKPLEDALALYERSQTLYQYCVGLLDQAALRIQKLTPEGGLEPFEE